MKFSIIMPVYNTLEKYLIESILSVKKQTYKKWELIIINDGSNKKTSELLNEYICENIFVKSIKNSGVSNARNIGTSLAKGDYILYLDSDDIISVRYLEDLNLILSKEKYDMVLAQVTFKRELLNSNKKFNLFNEISLNDELRKYYLSFNNTKFKNKDSWINRGPVARCIKKEIAKNNLFDTNLNFAEDVVWNLKLLNSDLKLAVIIAPEYYYRKNNGSATQSYRKNFEKELNDILIKIKQNISELNLINSREYATACFEYYRIYLKLYLYHKQNNLTKKDKYNKLVKMSKFIKNEIGKNKVILSDDFKQKILYFLFKNKLYLLIHLIEIR